MAEIDLRDQNNVRDMLPHKPMRLSMENKNLLSEKGDIYVGTGGTQTVGIEDDTYIIAETAKVSVPPEVISSNESAILIYDKTNNLQYKKSSESGFVTYTTDQTKIIVDPSGQKSGPKTTLLNNIFNNLTNDQKSYVRSQIGAVITGITAGDGIKVDSSTPSAPKVSVNLAQNSGMEFSSNQLKLKTGNVTGEKKYAVQLENGIPYVHVDWMNTTYTGGKGISVADGAISVNLATNSGLVFDGSSPGKLKLNVNSKSQDGDKYWVQIDNGNNHPYVNVPMSFLSYKVDQTKIFVDSSGQGSSLKTTLLNNIFYGLTEDQKSSVRLQIGAGSAQGIAGIAAGNGIKVDSSEPSSPKVSLDVNSISQSGNKYWVQIDSSNNHPYVNVSVPSYTGGKGISVSNGAISVDLAQNSGLVFDSSSPKGLKLNVNSSSQPENNKYWVQIDSSNNHPYVNVSVPSYTGGKGISVSNGAISVDLAQNSGLVFDSSSPKGLKLNVNSSSQPENNKYWVQIDSSNNHPYVNVSVPSGANQTIAYAPTTTSSVSDITAFGNNATVKLVPGDNISMMVSTTNNYIKIDATDTQYSAAKGGGIKLEGTSFSLDTGIITTNKDYAVALNNEGVPYVHVPWVEYTGGKGISVSNGAISVNLSANSGMEFSSNQLKLKTGTVTGEKKYAVQLENGIPYVNVPWTNTTYTGSNGISVSNGAISLEKGYNVPIEYKSSASSTAGFTSNKLYLIGTWTGV